MAEAQVIIEKLMENLNSLTQKKFGLLFDVQQDMDKLFSILSTIHGILEDAEAKRNAYKKLFSETTFTTWLRAQKDDASWINMLKHISYDASDALDEWSMEAQQSPEAEQEGSTSSNPTSSPGVSAYVSMSPFLNFNMLKIKKKMQKRTTTHQKIAKKMKEVVSRLSEMATQISNSSLTVLQIYGRDREKESIIKILLSNTEEEDVTIVPIVGMGGIGKTTLAHMVYNDKRVVNFFRLRFWVLVSYPFDLKWILKTIIQHSSEDCDLEDLESLGAKVFMILVTRRYLLVLDEVWEENLDLLETLKIYLEGGAKGSSIIVTTRTTSTTGTVRSHHLKPLSDEECWPVFKDNAFSDRSEENGTISLLRLNYDCLSPRLRHCLAYCSVFPKGYEMKKDELIGLWIANGFIQSHSKMEAADIGENIFHELVQRSFFKDCTIDYCGNIVACKMHDLTHDLASSLMEGECSTIQVDRNAGVAVRPLGRIRHLSLMCESPPSLSSLDHVFESHSSLSTLLFFKTQKFEHPYIFNFSRFRFLRALNLRDMSIEALPSLLCHLKHLRYLDLSKNRLTSLPESIHNLGNLQMLDLSENGEITTLPLSVGRLQCLRHFNLSQCSLASLPDAVRSLRSLQSLNLSGNAEITTLRLSVGELESLKYFNLSQCSVTSLSESIITFSNLRTLDISRNYSIATVPLSVGNLLSLRYFNLSDCNLIRLLPESIGGLKNLESLILRGCSSLQALPDTIGSMSSLRHLDLQGCHELIKMPVGIGQLTRLQTLNLFAVGKPDPDIGCSGLKELERLNQIMGELEIRGLENVGNSKDAREANLRSKYYLTKLKLSWGYAPSWQESNINNVLEDLQLPINLRQLIVNEYPWRICIPQGFLENLNGLNSLQILNCKELVTLSEGLQKLTSLEELRIECCSSIELLPVMGIQGSKVSLASLTIESCDSLKSASEGLMYLTSLKALSFQNCPELKLITGEFEHLISLQHLRIGWLPKLTAFPESTEYLTMLRHLEIEYCWNLRVLPEGLKCLTSLERLKIRYCPELQLAKEDYQCLTSLQTLEIEFLPKLRDFPDGIHHLTMLRHLKILRCENLRMLPEGVKYLTTLQSLELRDCHQDLHIRCEKEKGEHWHFISGIPYFNIDKPPKDLSTSADQLLPHNS